VRIGDGVDDRESQSLFNDTEMCVVTRDTELAIQTRGELWSEHLECDAADVEADPIKVIDTRWRPIAREQLNRQRDGLSATHRLIELPGVSKRVDRLRGPLSGLLDDG
jgi:hypothetical protein